MEIGKAMIATRWRGHEIYYDEEKERWVFSEDDVPVSDDPLRDCRHCNLHLDDDVDPCLGRLPGVLNACCGHGRREEAYIQFESGLTVRGFTIDSD